MGIKSKIAAAVEVVFAKLDELAIEATLVNTTTDSFNFSAGEAVTTTDSITVKVIPIEVKREADKTFYQKVLIRRYQLDDSLYDTIIINEREYRFECIDSYEGVVVVELRGE